MISVEELARNPEFKQKTLHEIIKGPETLLLKPMVRDYVESLSTIHEKFRARTQSNVDQSLDAITAAKARLFTEFPDTKDIGLAVFEADEAGLKAREGTNLTEGPGRYPAFFLKK